MDLVIGECFGENKRCGFLLILLKIIYVTNLGKEAYFFSIHFKTLEINCLLTLTFYVLLVRTKFCNNSSKHYTKKQKNSYFQFLSKKISNIIY